MLRMVLHTFTGHITEKVTDNMQGKVWVFTLGYHMVQLQSLEERIYAP